jgi:hypothetical protein
MLSSPAKVGVHVNKNFAAAQKVAGAKSDPLWTVNVRHLMKSLMVHTRARGWYLLRPTRAKRKVGEM